MDPRAFLENYQVTDIEKDPLPIKVLRNSITKEEIPGQAVHWGFDYLDQRSCPLPLINHILEKLYHEVHKTDFSHCTEAADDNLDGNITISDHEQYEPLKLMRAIVKKLDEICLKEKEDFHDSVDGMVESPDLQPHVFAVSYSNIKNSRRFMEDRMTVLPRMDRLFKLPAPVSYFAVFDGHNGAEAAAYGAAQLHQYLIHSMNQRQDVIPSISDAFESLDDVFNQKCRSGKVKSGSTVVLSLIMPGKLYVAWLGDSQAVLVKTNEVNNLVTPHKPERKDEIDRIRSLGGEVIQMHDTYRVNGNLAVSRAIGDADQKTFIIATPDIKMLELDGSEEFLILACDGLWDEISPEAAAQIVRRQVVSDPSKVSAISQKLIQQAKQKGSQDNISVIVVFLEPVESIKNRYEDVIEPDVETDITILKQSPEPVDAMPMEKFIEQGVGGAFPLLSEMNGHANQGDHNIISFGTLAVFQDSSIQMDEDDNGNHSADEDILEKKEVEEELSDADSVDEWQFKKPSNENLNLVEPIITNTQDEAVEARGENNPFLQDIIGVDLPVNTVGLVELSSEDQLHPVAIPDVVSSDNDESTKDEITTVAESSNPFSLPATGDEFPKSPDFVQQDGTVSLAVNEGTNVNDLTVTPERFFTTSMENVIVQGTLEVVESNISPDLPEMNGHVKQSEQLVDFLSFGNSKASEQPTAFDVDQIYIKKEVEEEPSDIDSADEWQFQKPVNQDINSAAPIPTTQEQLVENIVPQVDQHELLNDLMESGSVVPAVNDDHITEPVIELSDPFVTSEKEQSQTTDILGQEEKQIANERLIEMPENPTNPFGLPIETTTIGTSESNDNFCLDPVKEVHSSNDILESFDTMPVENVNVQGPLDAAVIPDITEMNGVQEADHLVDFLSDGNVKEEVIPVGGNNTENGNQEAVTETKNNEWCYSKPSNESINLTDSVSSSNVLQPETGTDRIEQEPILSETNSINCDVMAASPVESIAKAIESLNITNEEDKVQPNASVNEEEAKQENVVSETMSKPDDLSIPLKKTAEALKKTKPDIKPAGKTLKSPTKAEPPASKGRTAATNLAASKTSPSKGETVSKAGGLMNKSNGSVLKSVPKSTTTTATKTAASKAAPVAQTKAIGTSRVGTATAARVAPPKAAGGTETKPGTNVKPATGSTMRTRPTTAPAAPKPTAPKPAVPKTTLPGTTSPKRALPVGGNTNVKSPPTRPTAPKVAGESAPRPATGLSRPRPKPTTTAAGTAAPKTGPGIDVKKPTLKQATSTTKPALTSTKPPTTRPLPTSARIAPPAKPMATSTRPTASKPAPKTLSDTYKATGTVSNRIAATRTAPTAKSTTAAKKVDPSALKSKKTLATALGKSESTAKSIKSSINAKVATAGSEKADLIEQNGHSTPTDGNETVPDLISVNGNFNGVNGETEKQDSVKENGVHLDGQAVEAEVSTTSVPIDNLLG